RRGSLVPLLLYDRPLSEPELKVAEPDRARAERLPYLLANPGAWEWYPGDYPDTDERPLVVYTMDEGRKIRAAERRVREGLGERATVQVMPQGRYGAEQLALELHDPGATKWRALYWLLQRWQVRPEEVVAIGDDVNDIPMLEAAGLSFAMGNASDEVKAAADAVTAGNDDHGVVEALASVFER
ncbi:MAG: HAD hydrolase family protein, partial [Candidatus Brocadiae bacterium]|nr:HAD hydrolase family protein [Candidatus Brocadiia bacterium]